MKPYEIQFVHGIRIENDNNCHNALENEINSFLEKAKKKIENIRSNKETGRQSKIHIRIESITQINKNYTECPPAWSHFLLILKATEDFN